MSEPIRVLHILQRMEAGGTQALLMNIYRKIDRSKIQFDFLVVYKEDQFYDEEIKQLGGNLYKMSFREDLNLFKFKQDLNLFFKKHKEYQIVHCHAYTFGYWCLKEAKRVGIQTRIVHSHSNGMTNDNKKIIKKIMQKLFLKYSTDYFACSEEAGRFLFGEKKFKILPNAIDSSKFIASDKIRKNIRNELMLSDKFVIGHVGRFQPEKNHFFLLEVFCEINKLKNNSILLLIGSGPLEKKVKIRAKELNIEDKVIFLQNRKDINRIYQAMDVFIFPSLYEGLGIVAIEAQASGIPIVCSDRIPKETNITPLYERLSLSKKAKEWAIESINISNHPFVHNDMSNYILESGFDLTLTVEMLQEFYDKCTG